MPYEIRYSNEAVEQRKRSLAQPPGGRAHAPFSGTGANMEFGTMQSPDPTLTGGTENALCVASMRNSPNKIALGC